jgi:6-phosphogluconolactonase (cycloisomerase 2 family)
VIQAPRKFSGKDPGTSLFTASTLIFIWGLTSHGHSDGILYTVLELSSEITAHTLPKLPEPAKLIGIASTVSSGQPDENMLAAEILVTPSISSEPARIYVSNRNDPHEHGDTIAVFTLATLTTPPKLVGEVRTGLKHVRGMVLDPSGRYLVAGGVNGPGVKVFERAPDGEWLREVAYVEVDSPTGFAWL